MCEIVSFSSHGEEKSSVRHVVQQSMADDPVARYIVRESQLPKFWDGMMSVYWSSQPQELHLMTQGCESVVFARFHPQDKVASSRLVLSSLLSAELARPSAAWQGPFNECALMMRCALQPGALLWRISRWAAG